MVNSDPFSEGGALLLWPRLCTEGTEGRSVGEGRRLEDKGWALGDVKCEDPAMC